MAQAAHRGTPPRVIPGFGLTLGVTLAYLGLVVLVPLSMVGVEAGGLGWAGFAAIAAEPRTLHALAVSFGAAAAAAAVNAVFGTLLAWVLVRYRFPGRRIVDALVDLPFALPTAVAGISLAALYAPNGWIGGLLAPLGVKVAYTPLGIGVALVFVGLPFVVRTVQPVLAEIDAEVEESAAALGATRAQGFVRVVLPLLAPALLTGFTMAFARGVGEYGSVIFIAGNIPMVSEIAPLLIVIRLEEYRTDAAAAIAALMLAAAFALLLALNCIQAWHRRRVGAP
ncbi:sulfate ABC transporter permease subunit CysT [Oleispirillum naphthae]|uniref:sulfate ABC transporter permease subunit CysT n=1 Tax=Oleispirillum naphthae TaxID=2838853 RepID=UPI0030822137